MRSISRPTHSHATVYDECVVNTVPEGDRNDLLGFRNDVLTGSTAYDLNGAGALNSVQKLVWKQPRPKLLGGLYSTHLVGGGQRALYDGLIKAAKGVCPYCNAGEIWEMDHFLPKSKFPEYAVLPTNLVPICHPCNHRKRARVPIGPDRYFIHPYFDRLPQTPWLIADLSEEHGGPTLRYRIDLDEATYGNLARRLRYHFETLQLDRRFRTRSSTILSEMEDRLDYDLAGVSPDEVSTFFVGEADRCFRVRGNSMESAAYRAASSNSEFCAGKLRS